MNDKLKELARRQIENAPIYESPTAAELNRQRYENRKKRFNETAFGRTITGRNKTGKILYTVAGVAVGATTGVNIDPILQTLNTGPSMDFIDMNWIEIALTVITGLIGFLVSRELVKGLLQEILAEVQDIVDVTEQAVSAESPEGANKSEEEKKLIRKEMDDLVMVLYRRLVRSRLARLFGIHKGVQTPEK